MKLPKTIKYCPCRKNKLQCSLCAVGFSGQILVSVAAVTWTSRAHTMVYYTHSKYPKGGPTDPSFLGQVPLLRMFWKSMKLYKVCQGCECTSESSGQDFKPRTRSLELVRITMTAASSTPQKVQMPCELIEKELHPQDSR